MTAPFRAQWQLRIAHMRTAGEHDDYDAMIMLRVLCCCADGVPKRGCSLEWATFECV